MPYFVTGYNSRTQPHISEFIFICTVSFLQAVYIKCRKVHLDAVVMLFLANYTQPHKKHARWKYTSIHSWRRHYVKIRDEIQSLAASPLGKDFPSSVRTISYEAGQTKLMAGKRKVPAVSGIQPIFLDH